MSEPAKVRLVRCPKCENLLSELTDYSVYQCGGCGAVLSAKNINGDVDALSEKSGEDRFQLFSGRFHDKSKNIGVSELNKINIGDVSEDDINFNGSSSNRNESRRFLHDRVENYGTSLATRTDKRVVEDGVELDDNINRISGKIEGKNFEEMKPQIGSAKGLERSGEQLDWKIRGSSDVEGFQRAQRINIEGTRYSNSKYLEEGPSNYQLWGNYGYGPYGELLKDRNDLDDSDDLGNLGGTQAELLRKLDELKYSLSQSCDVVDKPKDKVPIDIRMAPPDPYGYSEKCFPDSYSAVNRTSITHPIPDYAARPSYANLYAETSPFMDRHAMVGHRFYPPIHGRLQEFEDPLRSQRLRRVPHQAPAPFQFQQKPPYARSSGTYIDGNLIPMDAYESYPPNINHHYPSCSCFHCYNNYQVPRPVPPNAYGVKQFSDVTTDQAFYHQEYQNARGAQYYGTKFSVPATFISNSSVSHARWPGDLKSEASNSVHNRPPRVLLTNSGRQCQPIAGGAPFLACQNCHEVLQVPKKMFLNETLNKMRCGSCSTLILLTFESKRLDVSIHAEANATNEKFNISQCDDMKRGRSNTDDHHPNHTSLNFSSGDYDNSGYNFQSMDMKLGSVSTGIRSSIKSADVRSPHSTFSSSSEKEENVDSLTSIGKNSDSTEQLVKGKISPPPAGSPLQDYFDYSNKYHAANRFGDGNRSARSEREKMVPKKTISRQNSMKDASATEIEISSNEYSNTGTSLDSGEASRGGDQMRANKAADSFLAGIIRKSFGDSKRSNNDATQERANVTVNGIFVSERLIKKAEKLAGLIHPGHYWYDFRAGFWGVMGGPCLGIIPPFIEEFNYPMPKNCTGGDTGVFVNGRELHQKDLNLLGSRGLPTDRGRSFIVEISGRVLDEDNGEELKSLGKLAPTIQKFKHGFGMKDPKAVV